MARKPQPGKKFKYRLETVLKVRKIAEREEKEVFARRQREYLSEKEKEEALEMRKKTKQDELKSSVSKGPISNFEKVLHSHAHLSLLKKNIEGQIEKVLEATKKVETQRVKLIKSVKERKVMEKDKDNRKKDYKKMSDKLETDFLDEISTQRYKRRED